MATAPPKKARRMTPRPQREPDMTRYSGRVAAKLRELREAQGWSVIRACDRLETLGYVHSKQNRRVPDSTMYAYERGVNDLPLALIPYVARLYGYATATGWMPN